MLYFFGLKKRPLGLLLLLGGLAAIPARAISPDSLAGPWMVVAAGTGSAEAQKADSLTLLDLRADGSFTLSASAWTGCGSGAWALRGDSLQLRCPGDSLAFLFHVARAPRQRLRLLSPSLRFELAPPLAQPPFVWADLFRGILGLIGLLLLNWLLSSNRRAIDWRLVGWGLGLQLVFAVLVLKVDAVRRGFDWVAGGFVSVLQFASKGAEFVFAGLITDTNTFGYIFAFQVLPTIVFFSALMSVLYYAGIIQRVVYGMAWVMSKTMGLSGAESLSAAGNIFLGQTEAPLLIKPYLEGMNRSEILAVMTGGMATIAGGVFAAYIGYLGGSRPAEQQLFATHLLTASILSAPAALVAAKMLLPQTEPVNRSLDIPRDRIGSNLLEAISIGTGDGLKLAVNVGVMLLVFTALIEMLNALIGYSLGGPLGLDAWVCSLTGGQYQTFNLQFLFGLMFAPIAWLLGVSPDDMLLVGQLLGEKTIINEFYAYTTMGTAKYTGGFLHYKSLIIATYALCGFANFASIGIQIGGIGSIAPSRRVMLSELGIKALIGGTLASLYTAAIAGMLVSV
jgi:CNT family concentrative nucleoside transporter